MIVNKDGTESCLLALSGDEAALTIEKLNIQSPLKLGVVIKPSEEVRLKTREPDLLC